MQILNDYRVFPSNLRSSVTIGNFDGLHLGHRKILQNMVRMAKRSGTVSVLMTFSPHPLKVLHPDRAPKLIVSNKEKIERIGELGIDYLLIVNFDEALSRLSAQAFVREILVDALHAKHLFVGHNFVFGHRRSGDVDLLQAMGREFDYTVEVTPPVEIRGNRVSSTWIRELIQSGRISLANRLLGRYYSIRGRVVRGKGLGAKALLPTLNLESENEILPAKGVYVTFAGFDGNIYPAVTNIGTRPTVAGTELSIETHVLDRHIPVAPKSLELQFLHRLRDEKKFPSVEALKAQLGHDVQRAQRFFRLLTKNCSV
jgi:riboflavin kinase/FMN adenylyltransferase